MKAKSNFGEAAVVFGAHTGGWAVECPPDLIRKYAYQLFEARGCRPGREMDDWLQVERELKYHWDLYMILLTIETRLSQNENKEIPCDRKIIASRRKNYPAETWPSVFAAVAGGIEPALSSLSTGP